MNKEENTYELVNKWLSDIKKCDNKYRVSKLKGLIVTKMLPIIKKIAKTIARRSYDPIEDMVQAGCIGLLKAIDSYDSRKNNNFKTYAGYFIIGEMKHYLRDKLNAIRVPRHIQELSYRITTFTNNLTEEELMNLTNDDVAEVLKVKPKDVEFVQQVERRKTVLSLEEIYNTDSDKQGFEEVLSYQKNTDFDDVEDLKIALNSAINQLPENLKQLILLFYEEDLTQKEIAIRLNISQMQVSRGLKKAFSILYKIIADNK